MQNVKINMKTYLPDPHEMEQRDRKLKKACRDFESVLTYQLLRSMRQTVDKCDLFHGGRGEEIYQSMLDMELAKKMADFGPNSLARLLYNQLKGKSDLRDDLPGQPQAWPLNGTVSSGFGWRNDPFTGERRFHYGTDIAAPKGSPIRAVLPGKVTFSGVEKGYGNVIILDHGRGLTSLYAHNSRNLVTVGTEVKEGAVIAEVGSTGSSTGPHLHFEVRRHEKAFDPIAFLPELPRHTRTAMKLR